MIRMVQSRSAEQAKAYFTESLSKADYYINDQELAGTWQGKLAARLGLGGLATKDDFFALAENIHPTTGKPLTPRTKEERTIGYDINFHCPKSVSILHAFSGDNHILTAFQDSVAETMQAIEADAQTRVRQEGQSGDRATNALVWAEFVHQTARPVEGYIPDPHLHSHCFTFNVTWDSVENRYKAGQFRDIKRDMPYYQARFHKTLADKLVALGYQIRKTDKSFEIEGVPQKAIAQFSKRTDEIGRIAKEHGITDPKELSELGARTRAKKQKGMSIAELKQGWQAQIKAAGIDKAEGAQTVRYAPNRQTQPLKASQCVDFALLHCFERASVMDDRRLLETAYKHALGNRGVSLAEITQAFQKDRRVIQVNEYGRTLCTTKEVLSEEKRMVALARAGQGKLAPLYETAPKTSLTGQQAEAVAHVLTTPHRVSIIRGAAGSGKTTLMREAVAQINAAGKQVLTVAPTAQASRGVLKEEGFAGAETVAKLLVDKKMQEKLKGQVLWVDEAGLLGTKDMTALLELVTKQDARLVLGGDTRQHASVIRGDALRVLNTVGGIKTAEVSKIYRQQKEDYRAAVEDLSKGYVKEAFEKLDAMDAIHTVDNLNPHAPLVEDYIAALKRGKDALVISPTHAQGEAVTEQIRRKLREAGMLGKRETNVPQFKNINLTEAEKSDPRKYQAGQVIQFNQNAHDFMRGSRWTVASTDDKGVTVLGAKGETKRLPLAATERFSVYRQQDIALSKGDIVMITHNGFDAAGKRLNNGATLEVVGLDAKGGVTLRNKHSHETYTLSKDFAHIAHAHCVTSHASQGKTVQEVFIHQPAATFPATDAKQFYVSVSRAKERVHIYTDDREELLHHARELGERKSALEMVGQSKLNQDFDARRQRQENEKNTAPPTQERTQTNINVKRKKDHEQLDR